MSENHYSELGPVTNREYLIQIGQIAAVLSPDQVRQKLRNTGQTIAGWARTHGYRPTQVVRVLGGFDKAHYGKGHEIAVRLGLKTGL